MWHKSSNDETWGRCGLCFKLVSALSRDKVLKDGNDGAVAAPTALPEPVNQGKA